MKLLSQAGIYLSPVVGRVTPLGLNFVQKCIDAIEARGEVHVDSAVVVYFKVMGKFPVNMFRPFTAAFCSVVVMMIAQQTGVYFDRLANTLDREKERKTCIFFLPKLHFSLEQCLQFIGKEEQEQLGITGSDSPVIVLIPQYFFCKVYYFAVGPTPTSCYKRKFSMSTCLTTHMLITRHTQLIPHYMCELVTLLVICYCTLGSMLLLMGTSA